MTLSVTPLLSGGYLVKGTDHEGNKGSTILNSERWDLVQHLAAHELAEAEFDEAVAQFFQPLTDAADAARALLAGPTNDYGTVTIGENVEGSHAKSVELDEDGIILNILANGNQNLLLWVGDDKLVAVRV